MPALPTEPELLSYLRQGRIIMIGTGDVPFDQILGGRMESAEAEGFDAGTLIDHGCILTDGTWFWFGSYIHYVKTHHIRLCEEFIAYAKGQNWTIDGGLIPIHNIDYRMLEKSAFA